MKKRKIEFRFAEKVEKLKKWIEKIELDSLPKSENDYLFCFHRSNFVKVFTLVITFIAIALSLYFIIGVNSGYLKWWVPLFSLTILALGVISSPVAVNVGTKEIEIHALLEVTRIRLSSIEHVYSLNSTYAKLFIIPVLTTFGFLGYNGRYYDIRNRRWVKLICTEHNNLIMIECIGRKSYVISATNRGELINEITEQVNRTKLEMKEMIERHYTK